MPERIDIRKYVPASEVGQYNDAFLDHLRRYHFAAETFHEYFGQQFYDYLDAPCGYGYGTEIVRVRTACRHAYGVDIDLETAAEAQKLFPQCSFWRMDLRELVSQRAHYLSHFRAITCFEGLEHVLETEDAVEQLYRCMAPNSLLIASIPHEASTNEWHRRFFPTYRSVYHLFAPIFGRDKFTVGAQCPAHDGRGLVVASRFRDTWEKVRNIGYWIVIARR